jgi:hypothetical protein
VKRVCMSWLVSVCALMGCEAEFEPASRVTDLRLLAVQADQPLARPGEAVTLRALHVDPAGHALQWAFGLCDPGASSVVLDCLQNVRFEELHLTAEPVHTLVVPEGALEGSARTPFVGAVVVACPGTLRPGDTQGVPLVCENEEGGALELEEFEVGVKRLFVRDDERNHNPVIQQVLWDGEPWPEHEVKVERCERGACKKHRVELRAPDAVERGRDTFGQQVDELVVLQFYATGGSFEDDVRVLEEAETTWRARKSDLGTQVTFWFVIRDDRGGVSWTSRVLNLEDG